MARPNKNGKSDEKWTRPSISHQSTPGDMERKFRVDLGAINPLLCLTDTALRRMEREIASQGDPKKFLHTAVMAYHPRLYTDHLNFQDACRLMYIAHVALIISRLDHLCDQLQRHQLVWPKVRELAQGDFVRKTLYLLLQSRTSDTIKQPMSPSVIDAHLEPVALSLMDYYRYIRNIQLHGQNIVRDSEDDSLPKKANNLNLEQIRAKFGSVPSNSDSVAFIDVILCSKAAQSIAKGLCRAMIDMAKELSPELKRRFGNVPAERRRHAAAAFLRQEFLLDDREVNGLLFEMSWLA